MDVRCPQCQTLYELDDDQVGARSVTLKCSQCQHVFRLEGRQPLVQENQRRWMIRRAGKGDVLYLNSFDVLHEWIMKQEVSPADEISRTGDKWATLGSVGEFTPMFQVVESISRIEGQLAGRNDISSIATRRPDTPQSVDPPKRSDDDSEPVAPPTQRERVRTSIQYGGAPPDSATPVPGDSEEVTRNERPSMQSSVRTGMRTPHDLPPGPRADELETAADSSEPEWDVDLPTEAEASGAYPSQSSRRGTLIFVGILGLTLVGGYFVLFGSESLSKDRGEVVAIGPTADAGVGTAADPLVMLEESVDEATSRALQAAALENDGIWTMWHETASEPFYVALDTAYAAADDASADVELQENLRTARTALENGRSEEATRRFLTVLNKDPGNPAATTGLGWALLATGKADEAIERFQTSIDANPSYGDAYIGLGSAYRQLGEAKKAYDAYDHYLGRFPKGEKASIASYQMEQLKKQLGE